MTPTPDPALLSVENLSVTFSTRDGVIRAVRDVSLQLHAGKTLAIVGESGSGKTVLANTILGLTRDARVDGRVIFDGRDLLTMRDRDLRAVRGAHIAMVFQNPHSSLHPSFTIGAQIIEAIRVHERVSKADARARAIDALTHVGIPHAGKRVDDYPHHFSGGMLQRAMIAMCLVLKPRVLIADEPTTALDVTVQAQILALLRDLQAELGMALLLVTHDLGVVAQCADDVVVMYAGQVMESAERRALFRAPAHPYTIGLLGALPRGERPGERLVPIAGQPPNALDVPEGCPFHPRCTFAEAQCRMPQQLHAVEGHASHQTACWRPIIAASRTDIV